MPSHSHRPEVLRRELLTILETYGLKINYLSNAAEPLSSVATSTSVLTILSVRLFFGGSSALTRFLAGVEIILLIITVFISLMLRLSISRGKLRLARVQHDLKERNLLNCQQFSSQQIKDLIRLSHLAKNSLKTIDDIQWLYLHGLWKILYGVLSLAVVQLVLLILFEIPYVI